MIVPFDKRVRRLLMAILLLCCVCLVTLGIGWRAGGGWAQAVIILVGVVGTAISLFYSGGPSQLSRVPGYQELTVACVAFLLWVVAKEYIFPENEVYIRGTAIAAFFTTAFCLTWASVFLVDPLLRWLYGSLAAWAGLLGAALYGCYFWIDLSQIELRWPRFVEFVSSLVLGMGGLLVVACLLVGWMKRRSAVPLLIEALRDSHTRARSLAAISLIDIVVQQRRLVLRNPKKHFEWIVDTFARISPADLEKGVAALLDAREDEDAGVRREVMEALPEIEYAR